MPLPRNRVGIDEMSVYFYVKCPRAFFFCLSMLFLSFWNPLYHHLKVGVPTDPRSLMSIFYCQSWRHVFATSHSPWPSSSLCSRGASASLWTTEAWPPSRTTSSTAWTPCPVSSRCWWLTRSGSPARWSSPLDTGSPTPSCSGFYKVQVTALFIHWSCCMFLFRTAGALWLPGLPE